MNPHLPMTAKEAREISDSKHSFEAKANNFFYNLKLCIKREAGLGLYETDINISDFLDDDKQFIEEWIIIEDQLFKLGYRTHRKMILGEEGPSTYLTIMWKP